MKKFKLIFFLFFISYVVCCYSQKPSGKNKCVFDIDSLYSTHINAFIDSLDRQAALNRHAVFVINIVDQNLEKCNLNFSISYIYNKSEFFEVNPIGYYQFNNYFTIVKSDDPMILKKVRSFNPIDENAYLRLVDILTNDDDPIGRTLYRPSIRVVKCYNGSTKIIDYTDRAELDPIYRIIHYNFDSSDFIIRKIHPDSISEKIPY